VRRVFRRSEDTLKGCFDYVEYIQSTDKSSPHEQDILKKEYSEVRFENATNSNLDLFHCFKEINWHFMLKPTVYTF
jgi:hypothetical protein